MVSLETWCPGGTQSPDTDMSLHGTSVGAPNVNLLGMHRISVPLPLLSTSK